MGQPAPRLIRSGALEIDLGLRFARRHGIAMCLTREENDALTALTERPCRVVTHPRILAAACPDERQH